METQKTQKTQKHNVCNLCDFTCSNVYDYRRHLLTRKHKNNVNGNKMETLHVENYPHDISLDKNHDETLVSNIWSGEKTQKNAKYTCDCGKLFNTRCGLWKHKQKCCIEPNKLDTNTVMQIIHQNEEFKTILLEQNNKILDLCKTGINNTTNINNNMINSNNKSFNLNVFLNEKCKDAMNINDFVDSIQITVDDIEDMGKLGYVNGLSKLIIKNLKAIDVHLRPVHCTDQRRETVYMKEKNQWSKDNDDKQQIRNFIKLIANKNSKNVNLFKRKYPDCDDYYSKYNDQYNKIIMEAFGGFNTKEYDSETKIIKKLVKEISIDKDTEVL